MNVLGITAFYHDSAACVMRDGKVTAAAQLERFSRKKHDQGFPTQAIEWCLKESGITIDQVDAIGFYEKPYLKFERLLFQFIETFPASWGAFTETIPSWFSEKLTVGKRIEDLGYNGKVYYLEHHLSHAAASFLCSPFDEAAIFTIDGVGEWATATTGTGKGNQIELLNEIRFPHSLGLLYSTITAYLGFSVNNSEYKVMGLAPYGSPRFKKEFDQIIQCHEDGSFSLDMKYFSYHQKMRMPSPALEELLGQPSRKKEDPVTSFHQDVAASLQLKTEEALFNALNALHRETKSENLCLAGGVALNSVANGKILSNTPFKRLFIQPAAGDAGSAMGAALYVTNSILGKKRSYVLDSAFLGPSYSNEEIRKFLVQNNIQFSEFKNDSEIAKKTAKWISENRVVGWFQGRMEWGPRALGSRSILSNACNPDMKEILNLKVKHREAFRPFAPAIPFENVSEWFETDNPLPEASDYMLMVYPIRKEKRKKIPAVTHVDGSGRLQVIRKKQHPLYYNVIKEFEKISGVPIVINTSFNIRGEPIVCTPQDAYRCMMGTGIDSLVMGNYCIDREKNPKDIWDSESIATD